jgi:putative two-component system response regulator
MADLEGTRERVLVVDDQEPVARTIARWLDRDGFDCDLAHSVAEARALAERNAYGLVFADVHMPGGSGLELARYLKERDTAIQVVIVTGNTTLETAIEALRLDADDYLIKPFDPAALRHAAQRASEHHRLLLENRDYSLHLEERVRAQADRLERLYLSSVHSLVRALEAKDPHTRGHSDRVAEYALALLDRVGGVDPDSLQIGAQLHDIGKIGIPGGVLRKVGPLNGSEIVNIKEHPIIGVQILSPLLEDETALHVVRHHHERWDGGGYPDGLAAEEIPLAARIAAVADTYDAITTARPYRGARSPEQAVAEIQREAGRQFDPVVARHAADAFLRPIQRVS